MIKKISKILLSAVSVLLIFVLFTGFVDAVWGGSTSFETTDGSTTPTDGNDLVGTGDGSGWTGNWANSLNGSRWDYDNAQAAAGSWSVTGDGTGGARARVTRALSPTQTTGIVSFQMRKDSNVNAARFQLEGATDVDVARVVFDTDGGIKVEGGTTCTIAASQALNTWHKVHLKWNTDTDKLDARMDADSSWTCSNIDFISVSGAIEDMLLTCGDADSNFCWIDDIGVGSEPVVAANPPQDPMLFILWGLGVIQRDDFYV